MATLQQYDDGSAVWLDDSGNIIQVRDSSGVVGPPNRAASQSFLDTLVGSFTNKLSQAFAPRPIYTATVANPTGLGGSLSALMPLLILGLGAFAVVKLAK